MCPHEEKLTAWLLGDLSPEEQAAFTKHLETCETCRAMRDDFSSVLSPLQSGLAKDVRLPFPNKAQPTRRKRFALPYEWVRLAAIFVISFGMLFAFIGVMYQQTSKQATDQAVTNITFKKSEPPAPPLAPLDRRDSPDSETIASLADDLPSPKAAAAPAVTPPPLPATEPRMPTLRRLIAAEPKEESTASPMAEAAAPEAPAKQYAGKEKSVRDRSKVAAKKDLRGAEILSKPILLATVTPEGTNALSPLVAPTNAVPTNAIPTNALAPTATKR